jgi:hypothetical protein
MEVLAMLELLGILGYSENGGIYTILHGKTGFYVFRYGK